MEGSVVEALGGLDVVEDKVGPVAEDHQDDGDKVAEETIRGNGEGGDVFIITNFSKDSGVFVLVKGFLISLDEAQDAAVFLGGISELQEHDVVSAGDSVEFFKVHSEDVVQSLKLIHADINNIDNFALALNSVRGSLKIEALKVGVDDVIIVFVGSFDDFIMEFL